MGFLSDGKGKGSVFYFELPLFAGDSTPSSISTSVMRSLSSILPSNAKTLVVPYDEDEMESGFLPPLQITETQVDLNPADVGPDDASPFGRIIYY